MSAEMNPSRKDSGAKSLQELVNVAKAEKDNANRTAVRETTSRQLGSYAYLSEELPALLQRNFGNIESLKSFYSFVEPHKYGMEELPAPFQEVAEGSLPPAIVLFEARRDFFGGQYRKVVPVVSRISIKADRKTPTQPGLSIEIIGADDFSTNLYDEASGTINADFTKELVKFIERRLKMHGRPNVDGEMEGVSGDEEILKDLQRNIDKAMETATTFMRERLLG